MRYVGKDEQVQMIAAALRRVPETAIKQLGHHEVEIRLRARVATAVVIADAMRRLEVLTSAPEGAE